MTYDTFVQMAGSFAIGWVAHFCCDAINRHFQDYKRKGGR